MAASPLPFLLSISVFCFSVLLLTSPFPRHGTVKKVVVVVDDDVVVVAAAAVGVLFSRLSWPPSAAEHALKSLFVLYGIVSQ